MEHSFVISKAGTEAAQCICTLAHETFRETYGPVAPAANLEKYIAANFNEARITQELQDPGHSYYIAYVADQPVGFTKITHHQSAKGMISKHGIKLDRIYVVKAYQGLSIGTELMKKVYGVAREAHADYIWLMVWQKNERAIQFYQKAGFVIYETDAFHFGDEVHQDFLMKLDLYYAK